MRIILLIALAIVAGLYFTIGLRFGSVMLSKTHLFNANGHNEYAFRTVQDRQTLTIQGLCTVKSGSATLRLYDPQGRQVGAQVCQPQPGTPNEWAMQIAGKGFIGDWKVTVDFSKFTGTLDLKEKFDGAV